VKSTIIHLAAGGTGGHVFPALAVAEVLKVKGFEPRLLTDRRGAALLAGIENPPFKSHVLSAASPFQRGIFRRIIALGKLACGALTACFLVGFARPSVMIGFGGYPSFAPLLVARLLGVPTMVHEQNAYLGRANKLIAAKASLVALSWPKTTNLPDNVAVHVTGMPVRDAFFAKRHEHKDGQKLVLTVLGGSQGAEILGQLVPDALAMVEPPLRERIEICQQARPEQIGALRDRYNALGMAANISGFFTDMPTLLARSDLVISRSGASSIAELAAIGRASLMMPLPSAMDDHQRANAIQMERVGGGYCLDEATVSPAFLATQIVQLFEKTETLRTMAKNATALASPDAAHDIATLAIGLIKTRKLSAPGTIT
jgi:UDP-N-acetylglucosamine--N-acetylmuramyl-(pentapeptide) pyrophosphoryl-undecaprenol N-acetylglucosamine transferase